VQPYGYANRFRSLSWYPEADLSNEPTTLVTFEIREVPNGTELTITESGFDATPPLARRAEAFTRNADGWNAQADLIAKYLARTA